MFQELNNEPDADLSSVPEPLFPLGSTPTGPGSPGWSIETHVPHGDKDPVDSQKVFKASEGWTICAHHPLMVDGDVASIHALMLGNSKVRPPRRRSPLEDQVLDEANLPLLDVGFIEECPNPVMSHECVIVVKKNPDTGEWTDKRCCVNYGAQSGGINAYTTQDFYQLPLPEDLFRKTEGSKFFSVIDMKSGFMQTPMDPTVRPYCAFWWRKKLWQPTRNNFGLKNMPAYFQQVMDKTLADAGLAAHACVFIDDVLIFTEDLETHLQVVAKLFAAFKLVNLKAHPGKSRICFPCIEYLGHNIGSLGLTPNEVKVAAIRALPNPSNISELRRVLGFANYYRGYVPHFSEIAKPLTDLLKKDVKWEWTAERASAWRDLKDALCCPNNALRHPDRNVRYVLHTDWSQKGLSAVLGQVDPETGTEYLIACTSRSCNVHEARYGSYKGEMMAAVWGVRTFRCYLIGAPHPFILLTDHKGLSWLMSNKELEGQYARWSVMLSEFNFIIEYKPGVKHIIADVVPSRFPRSTTADVTGTRESYHQFVSTQQLLSHSEHGLDCLADCLASAPSDFDAYCFNHVADFLNARSIDCTQDYLDDEDCLISPLIDYSHMGNTAQADDDVSASHSTLFTPSSELLLHTVASHLLPDSQHHAIDIHDLSSMDVSISAYAHSVDLAFVSTTQHELQLKAARQVELCHSSLTLGIPNSSELPLRVAPSPFGDVVHSICTAPVSDCCISAIHTDGVRVIELFGCMVSGLDCLLRNGVKILQYSYCDLSHHARAVAHHRLTQLTVQYPDQLPLEAWSSAFTALPQDVYAITEEHLSFAGALEEDPILLIAGFECADLSPAGSRKGLQGSKSSTFYPLLSVLASLQRMRSSYAFPLAYLIENTATQFAYGSSRAMKDSFHELCAKIGSPVVLDAANVGSYAHRLRNYRTNLVSSSALQCILDSFERDPDLNLSDVLYTTNPQICTKTRSYPWCTANVPGKLLKVLPTLVARVDSYAFRSRPDGEGQGQVLNEEGNLVPLTLEERERILGYPTGSTDIPVISFNARHHILGSCFDAFAVSHLIACAFALRFSMVLPDDSYLSSHVSELGGGQLSFDLPDNLLSVVLSGREFLSLAAQHLAVERQESSTSTDPDIWLDDHTLAFLHHPDMDLSMHSDAERKRILRRASSYVMTGKLLYRKMPDGNLKVVPEPSLRLEIAKKLHEDNGHFGRRRTTALTMLKYWWNGLWDDCSTVVKSCQACSCTKVSFNSQSPVLHPLPIRGLMYRWSLDTAGPFEPTSRGHTRVLVCVEHFSKFVEVFPLKDKSSAEIAYHFLHGVIARYGAPAEVLTDGGGEFQAEFDDLLLKCLIDHRVTSPHHPEANGASERFVKTVKTGIARYVESTGSTSEWDLFLPWIAYGYRVTPHESTKLSPYKLVYAIDPIMPSSAREHLTAPISYDDPEIAAKSVLDYRSLLLAEHCATAGQNLLITQHRDTLRYAKLRSGAYMPQLREFKLGQFVYIKDHDSMHDSAKSLILRVKEVRPSGVLILMGRDNKTLAVNSKHCTPCHLPITEIEEASLVFAKPTIDLPCEKCNMPHDDHVMVLCDSCNRGYHIYCLTPPLTTVPPGIWVCPECSHSGVTELTIKTLWATDQFYQDARRAKEFRPTSGPRHKQRGRPRNIAIPATVTPPNAPALLLKRGPGRPKKFPTAMVALMPTYKWSYPRAVEQGLPDLLPGIADPAFSKHISSFSPGGNRFKQHFSPVSAAELSTLLHLLDDSYSHSILDITHGAAAGVILHLPASESFSITTNEYLCDIPADFHLDPMQPESYTLIKEHHSMHIIIVCPALPLADILIPLTSIYAQHVACCLISKKYFLNSYYSRYAWLISLRAEDRLFIIPSDSNGATDNVWMLIFSSSGVKHSILRDSKDQLTGILLASSEYVLTS
ncbi:hypothetical protein CEUSTIGMA_g2191.t1 [Chlamydomonas eustigma]|uniref:Reverse transcriptase n=1 Tax=Chlamydomonas eustigma TaxID=1157962 RepID=A0A250WV76_9CHLO|nr:hypothetical protein CEUSTIGMA_g2191.t1 [Chlamydomonas eustigma]|eukprot:GAX74744.1 hypothetical protein CEUSTIGMA_g2191.t1 [Chlamydomonas eustigma]